jgi:hypothetical protein
VVTVVPERTVTDGVPGHEPLVLSVFVMVSDGLTTMTDASDGGLTTWVPPDVPCATAGVSSLEVGASSRDPLPEAPGARLPIVTVKPLSTTTTLSTSVLPVFVTA